MDHLVCFVPGMLALGAQHIPEVHDEHMQLAAALTDTCHAMYDKQRTGLAPEFVRFSARGMDVRRHPAPPPPPPPPPSRASP